MYSRHVPLPSGGSLVIDSTEAVVAIDVNSGKFREHADAETTAFKTDMEAADEIPRQLRLRDLGGVIICDFIDLRFERHRRELGARLHANFQKDRAKTKVLPMSQFGIIEITRQRMRPSLKRSIYCDCPYCKGAGLVKTPESMSLDVMRRLAIAAHNQQVARVELTIAPDVNFFLQNRKRSQIAELERESGKKIIIRADAAVGLDEARFSLFDLRDSAIYLVELGMSPPLPPSVGGFEPRQRGPQRGRRDGRNRNEGRRPPPPPRHQEEPEDAFDLDAVEDQVDQREEEQDMDTPPSDGPMPAALEHDAPQAQLDESMAEPSELAMDTAGPAVGSSNQPVGDRGDFDNGQDGGPRRRRRRGRRGRGRGRGANQGDQPQRPPLPAPSANTSFEGYDQEIEEFDRSDEAEPADAPPEPGNEALPPEGEGPPQREGGRRRRRRGGRGRGRGRNQNGAPITPAEQGQQYAPPPPPPPPAPRAAEATRHTPTGSTDKHLVSDEPIAPQPVHRPRSYRDLDSIPDDFD
jgi:ribonuclease E